MLVTFGVSTTSGQIDVVNAQWAIDTVNAPAQRWVHSENPVTIQHFTFNTPIGAAEKDQCGRVLFSNFHVSPSSSSALFPDTCPDLNAELPDHPLVNQVVRDCLEEAMDFAGLRTVLEGLHGGRFTLIA